MGVKWWYDSRMRLDKALSDSGYGTRTDVKALVRAGRVRVDGAVVRDPSLRLPDGGTAQIEVDGAPAQVQRHLHLMMHKPAGYLTALEDARRHTVAELVPAHLATRGLSPVGRLDADTTGLLLLTNDGLLAHRLANPKWHVDKVYHVWTEGAPFAPDDAARFGEGLVLGDGTECQPAELAPIGPNEALLTIREGKYHQVKRMMLATGRAVVRLHREAMGPLSLDPALAPGASRLLDEEEADRLYRAASLEDLRSD